MRWMVMALCGVAACSGAHRVEPLAALDQSAPAEPRVVPVTTASVHARALFEVGRAAEENVRHAAAMAAYRRAMEFDPGFLQAKARLGLLTPGSDGLRMLREASEAADLLPDAERVLIAALGAFKEGHQAQGEALVVRVAELVPDDWRMLLQVGGIYYRRGEYAQARTALERATELNLTAGPAWNDLGYTYAKLGDTDAAVKAFEWYAALSPTEPNPYDSMGEVLLWAGRLEDAEDAFLKAVHNDADFYQGWLGVAQTRFLRGDWTRGQEALDQALLAAPRDTDRFVYYVHTAWRHAAQRNPAAALAALEAATAETRTFGLDGQYAGAAIVEGQVLLAVGDPAGAQRAFSEAIARATHLGLEGGEAFRVQAMAELGLAMAEADLGKVVVARARLAQAETYSERLPALDEMVERARARILVADRRPAGAVVALEECAKVAYTCQLARAKALAAAGHPVEGEALEQELRSMNRREADYLAVWAAAGGLEELAAGAAAL
jgi:tetratricopeptide (TPR) repeat protein